MTTNFHENKSQVQFYRQLTKGLKIDKTRFHKELTKLGHIMPPPATELETRVKELPSKGSLPQEEDSAEDDSDNSEEDAVEEVQQQLVQAKKITKGAKAQIRAAALNKHVSEMTKLRKSNKIKVTGSDMPDLVTDFNQLVSSYKVDEGIISNLVEQGYTDPTPVQMQCWPLMLGGREVLATAPTGSGKTAAFLLPVIHHLKTPRALGFRAVIVSPTRELAEQTHRECSFLCQGTGLKVHLIDKVDKVVKKFGPNSSQKFDILVTTPNRLVYILKDDVPLVSLKNVKWLIIDECDRLFEAGKRGFRDQLATIYQACSGPGVQHALFSATHAVHLQDWCRDNLDNLTTVTVGLRNSASEDVDQSLVFCGDESGKIHALRNILREGYEPPCLLFVQTKERARQLFQELVFENVLVDAIHSDRTQKQREECVRAFRARKIFVLICTELMSRGIDFKGVNLVINYDFPPSLVSYIHRIGRTGRAQRKGKAITFWTTGDQHMIGSIARAIRSSGGAVPEWMNGLRRLAPQELRAARVQKDRGFVSEGAKYTNIERERRKKHQLNKKLAQLKTAGDAEGEKAKKFKQKLHTIIVNRKETERKELKRPDPKPRKRKRNAEDSQEQLTKNKKHKKDKKNSKGK